MRKHFWASLARRDVLTHREFVCAGGREVVVMVVCCRWCAGFRMDVVQNQNGFEYPDTAARQGHNGLLTRLQIRMRFCNWILCCRKFPIFMHISTGWEDWKKLGLELWKVGYKHLDPLIVDHHLPHQSGLCDSFFFIFLYSIIGRAILSLRAGSRTASFTSTVSFT